MNITPEILKKLLEDDGNGGDVQKVDRAKESELRELMASVDFHNPMERRVIADTVLKKLEEEIVREDISQLYVRRDTFLPGETPEYKFEKGLKAYVIEPGTIVPRSKLIHRKVTLATDMVGVHPEIELSELRGGRWGTLSNFKTKAVTELVGRRNATLWTVLYSSIPSTATNYVQMASTANLWVKKNFLVSGINHVDDTDPRGVKAIVGRRSALDFLNELGGIEGGNWSEAKKTERDYAGGKVLGTYRGVPVIALHQYTDGFDVNRINADNIMVMGASPDNTVLATIQGMEALEKIDTDNFVWDWNIREEYGAGVFFSGRNWRIAIT